MSNVTLRNVVKKFGSVTAVDNLNIEIKDEGFAILVGPSGCGKTTALRMIAGLEEVTSGEIYIGDRPVKNVAPRDRDIAMVFQNYALYPHKSVRDNIGFGLKMRKFSKTEVQRRVEEAADILGIHDLLDRMPKQLSGGQRQRVALGRAIVRKPKVFLFDEPLSNLDAKLRVAMRAEISKLHRHLKATMIYVTHDQVEAMTMADRIFIMNKGALQQSDSPLALYSHPGNLFVASFIGSPGMNFVETNLVRRDGGLGLEAEGLALEVPGSTGDLDRYVGRRIVLGVRPEHIAVHASQDAEAQGDGLVGRIDNVETLGSEILVYFTCGKASLVARINAQEQPLEIGQQVRFRVDLPQTRLFDPQTTQAIA